MSNSVCLENEAKRGKALKDGKKVKVNIEPVYSGTGVRPDAFRVNYTIDGIQSKNILLNKPGG